MNPTAGLIQLICITACLVLPVMAATYAVGRRLEGDALQAEAIAHGAPVAMSDILLLMGSEGEQPSRESVDKGAA